MSIYHDFYLQISIHEKIYGGLRDSQEYVIPSDPGLEIEGEWSGQKNEFHFACDSKGLYIGTYQVKAMIAQCAGLLEYTDDLTRLKQSMSIMGIDANGQFTGDKIYLLPSRTKTDGIDSFVGNVKKERGAHRIATKVEYALQPTLKMRIQILKNRMRSLDFPNILELGQQVGLGALRKFEAGKFEVVNLSTWQDYTDSIAAG